MDAEVITLTVEDEATECLRIQGNKAVNGATILLTDIYGAHQPDTQAVARRFADAMQTTVYIPDIFRGTPWSTNDEAGTHSEHVLDRLKHGTLVTMVPPPWYACNQP
jgi:hypothetical protein